MNAKENPKKNREVLIKELMDRPPQNDEELQIIKDECSIFGGVINPGKEVEIHWVPGQGWFWSFQDGKNGKNGSITADEKDAREEGLGYCGGVMTHEESHVFMSRPWVFDKKLWKKKGFSMGYNWIEDCRIEYDPDKVIKDGKDWVRRHLEVDAAVGGGLDYTGGSKKGSMSKPQQKVGYIPKHMMFGAVMRQYFFHKEYTGNLKTEENIKDFIEDVRQINPEVAEAFERVRPHLEDYYKSVPENLYPTEEEIMEKAKESGKIYENHIWPEYEKMVDQSYEEHTLQKFIEDLLDGVQFGDPSGASGAGGTVIVIDFDSLPPEVQQEIKEKMQGSLGGDGQSEEQSPGDPQSGSGGASGGEEEPSEQEVAQPGGEESSSESSDSEGGVGQSPGSSPDSKPESQESPGSQSEQGSFQDLSEKSQEAVKEAFEKVSEEDRQEISEKAGKEMGEVDKEVNETLQGRSDQEKSTREVSEEEGSGGPEGGGEAEKGEAESGDSEENENQEDEKEGEDGVEGGEQNVEKPPEYQSRREATPEEKAQIEAYEKHMAEKKNVHERTQRFKDVSKALNPIISTLKYNLEQYFYPNEGDEETFGRTGDYYHYDRRRRERIGEVNYEGRHYSTETDEVDRNYRFTILVDLSGSMESHIEEVFKTIVILAEVLTYLGIDFEVQGFSEPMVSGYKHSIYKSHRKDVYFGENLTDDDMQDIAEIEMDVDGGTPTSKAIANTGHHLVEKKKMDAAAFKDFLLVITDGSPTDTINPKIKDKKLSAKLVVDSIRKMAQENSYDLAMLGFGIGVGTDFVQDIFGQLPLGLRSKLANKINGFRKNSVSKGHSAPKKILPDQVSNAYHSAEELSHVLPDILEYILENWNEFR